MTIRPIPDKPLSLESLGVWFSSPEHVIGRADRGIPDPADLVAPTAHFPADRLSLFVG